MASQSANGDILASILAELRDLKSSHASLEQRLETLAISSPSRSTTPITGNGSSSSVAPIAIGARSPGGAGGLSTSAGSPPVLNQFAAGSPGSPGSGVGSGSGYQRKASVDYNSIGNAAKQEYLNWTRSNSGTPQGGISASDPNGKSSGRTESDAATRAIYPSRAILTTYPGQVGVTPLPLKWGAATAEERGPILASRQPLSLAKRNAIGAYGGAYSIYHALSVATGALSAAQRPNYTHTEPTFDVLPNPSWFDPSKICVLDPWGHLAQTKFKAQIDAGIDIRPTLSITRAHLKIAELDDAAAKGRFPIDGKIVIPSAAATLAESLTTDSADKLDPQATEVLNSIKDSAGVEVNVSKVAFENVWYLPGVADRLGVSEPLLRRCLFEDTGGMYPELLTRPDLKVFLPPIGGGTCYIFGPTQYLSDPSKKLAVRVHDACSGSDIFGSDICTCRPYLLHGIEECIKMAQNGGVGLVVYFQKEGRTGRGHQILGLQCQEARRR